jgi:hypothetical protein
MPVWRNVPFLPPAQRPRVESALVNREAVASSSIRSVGYDLSGKTLEVEFCDGRLFRYC